MYAVWPTQRGKRPSTFAAGHTLTRGRVRRAAVVVRPVVEVQLPGEQCGENVVRVVRITTRHTFQINRGARYRTPGREIVDVSGCAGRDERRSRRWRLDGDGDGGGGDANADGDGDGDADVA